MPYDNNHFIPESLLKRFACRDKNNKLVVFRFDKTGNCIAETTRKAGSEYHFYGENRIEIENRLEKIESEFGNAINAFRLNRSISKNHEAISQFIWVALFRTRNIRKRMKATMSDVFPDLLDKYVFDEGVMAASLDQNVKQRLAAFPRSERRREARRLGLSSHRDLASALAKMVPKDAITNELRAHIPILKNLIGSNQMINKSMSESMLEQLKDINGYKNVIGSVEWKILQLTGDDKLLIGDNIVNCYDGEMNPIPFKDFSKEMNFIVPISGNEILLGQENSMETELKVDKINMHSARSSIEFIYSSNRKIDERYFSFIGEYVRWVDADEIEI
jgi:hypothetical protein